MTKLRRKEVNMSRDNLLLGLMGAILLVGIAMTMQYTGYVIVDDTTVAFDWNETWDINGSFVRVSQGANVYDRDSSELLVDSQVVVNLLNYNLTNGLVYVDLVVSESVVDSESLDYMLFGDLPEEIIEVLPEVNESEPEEVLDDQEDILEPQDATNPPSHTAPILNATSINNYTSDNLTLFNQSTNDLDGDPVKNIINWYRNSTSLTVVNMPFEGGSNNSFAKDYSPYGNNISAYVADPVWNRTGGYDGFGAFEFDGTSNEFILIDNVTNLNFDLDRGGSFSIELRVKHFDTSDEQYFINKGISNSDKSNYRVYLGNNDKMLYRIQNGSESRAMAGNNVFELDTWYHVVLTVNQTDMVGYVNGEIDVNTSNTLTGRIGTSGHMFIGNVNAVNSPLNGSLDELRIWNRSLSHQQVMALYQNDSDVIVSQETGVNETWNATMTPNDAYIDGETLWSNDIIVLAANNVPIVSANVTSSSSLNYSNGTLIGAWEFTDADLEVEQDNETRWWREGVENTTFANMTSIESPNLTKGEVWNFSVRSYDGEDWSIWSNNATITIINAPPAHLTPLLNSTLGTNYSSANLTVWNQTTTDFDNDSVYNIINWYRNSTSLTVVNMPFEGGSNNSFAKDYSPYGNNITVAGESPFWNRTGGYDGFGAFEFDSTTDEDLIIANNTLLNYDINAGGALTIEFWFKNVQNGEAQYLFSKGKAGGITSAYYIYLTTDYLLYRIENETDSLPMVGTQLIVDDVWNHLVFVMNDTAMTGYINGERDKGVVHNMTGVLGSSDALFIGNHFSGTKPLNGSFDNFRMWNLSLSHEQVRALHNNRTDLIVSQTTKRNELWNASITPNDGYIDGETLYTQGLTILNAPPSLISFNLSSTDANNYTNGSLYINWSGFDADGDSLIDNETKWWRDGVENATFANLSWIESVNFTADEVWNASIRIFDGSNWSAWSENVSIVLQETPYMLSYTMPYVYDNDTAVDLNITTSKDSDCQYRNGTMNWTFFTDTGLRTHGVITGVDSYGIYTYYVRCNDSENTFVNDTLSFAVVKTIPNGLAKGYEKVNFTANESQTIRFMTGAGNGITNLTITTANNISNAYVKYMQAEFDQRFEGSNEGLLNGQAAKIMLVVDENVRGNITNSTWHIYHGTYSNVIAGPYILQFNISTMEWEILQTADNVQGATAMNTTNYRTVMFAATTNSTGSQADGSTGSSEGTIEAEVEIEEEEEYEEECGDLVYLNYDYLYKDEMVEMEVYDPCTGLLYVEFTPNKNINGTGVGFYRERNDESNQYLGFEVSPSNMVDGDISEMNFVFSIDRDWADANTEESCSLENFGVESEGGEEYYASYVDEDDSYYYFVSPYIEEFGVYHISAFECPDEPSIIEEITEAITEVIEEERELRERVTEASKSLFWVVFTLTSGNLLVYYLMKLLLIFKWNKKKYYDEDIKVESKRVGNVGMLKYYLIFNLAQAKDMNKLKIDLMREGWDINVIERVLLKIRDVPKDRLALFIYSKLAANFNEQALVNVLVEKGWEESRVRKLILLFRNI